MDFEERITAEIQSLFADEYRGDLANAYAEIERFKSDELSEYSANGPEKTAYLLRSIILVSVISGRLDDAYDALVQLQVLVDTDLADESDSQHTTNWGLRYAALKAHVDYNRRYPPCIPYQHELMMPVNGSMVGRSILGPTDIAMELIDNVKKHLRPNETNPSNLKDASICLALQTLIYFPMQRRTLTVKQHPMAPNGNWKNNSDGKSPEQIITEVNPQILKLVQNSNQNEPGLQTNLYFRRLLVELHYAIDSPEKKEVTKRLYDEYHKLGDKAGMANCKLIEADCLLSPPFASPVTQNLIPVHASNGSGECSLWDPVEKRILLKESDKAERYYEESLECFRESNCGRGQAAVLLRQGSILHAKACSLSLNNPGRLKLLEDVTNKYDEALKLLNRDEANSQVVKTNQILLDISKGSYSSKDLKQRASDIGKWGREHKNELLSFHLTLFMLRFARREWERYTNFDVAMVSYECAYSCATELGALTPAFVSMCSRAEIHYETNNSTAALVMVEHCINMFDAVLHYYDDLINATTDTPMGKMDRQNFIVKKFDFIWSVGRTVGGIYGRADDLDRFKSWEKRYLACFEEDENCVSQAKEYMLKDTELSSWIKQNWGATVDEILDESSLDTSITTKYQIADIMTKRSMKEGDWKRAESSINQFVEDVAKFKRIYTREMFRMLAYQLIGETTKIKGILDSMTDSDLFKDKIDDLSQQGHYRESVLSSLSVNALYACVIAEDWRRGSRILSLILNMEPEFLDETSQTGSKFDISFRQVTAGIIYLNNFQPEMAFQMLLKARHRIEVHRGQLSDVDAKVGALSATRLVEVYFTLTELCLRCASAGLPVAILHSYDLGHPRDVTWEEHALLFLEESRARSLLDSLESSAHSQPTESGRRMSEGIYKRRALTHLQSLSKRTVQQDQELAELVSEVEGLDVESLSYSTNDLINTVGSNIPPHSLFNHLSADVVVIEGAFYNRGCNLLAVTNKGVETFHRGKTRLLELQKLVMELMQVMRSMTGTKDDDEQDRKAQVKALSRQISNILLTPFAGIIRRKRHIIFSVSEPLSAFPFSMLDFDGKPLIMHAAVSQTPSLTVLHYLSQRGPQSTKPTVSVFTKALSQGNGSENVRNSKEVELPMAGIEAVNISNMFSTWVYLSVFHYIILGLSYLTVAANRSINPLPSTVPQSH
jgi:hypothetical protein